MKRILGKIPAIIALILGLISFGYLIASEIVAKVNPVTDPQPITPEHACFMTGYILSFVSAIPFVVEGICSTIRATLAFDRGSIVLNCISALLTFALIPAVFMNYIVWFCCYGIVFLAELILVILHITQKPPVNRYLPQMHT
jgi:hypothetical protein